MSKILKHLDKQMQTDLKADAIEVREVFNYLKEIDNGSVWSSKWGVLVNTRFKGFPSDDRTYSLTELGKMVLKGLKN